MTAPVDPHVIIGAIASTGPYFGQGGAFPYEAALTLGQPFLRLKPLTASGPETAGAPHPDPGWSVSAHTRSFGEAHTIEVMRFLAIPDRADRAVIRRTKGPVLDVGCGPGRMVAEALRRGRVALGIDVSPAAVNLAQRSGRPVLLRSIFDPLPDEGTWGTTLLLDGNIGIGGDPVALLARCAAVTAAAGTVVVEAHPDTTRHACFDAQLVDDRGVASAAFPWAQAGSRVVARFAAELGLGRSTTLTRGGRRFVLLRRDVG